MPAWGGCRMRKQRNRCFPTKTVAIWRQLDYKGHIRLVELYLEEVKKARRPLGERVEEDQVSREGAQESLDPP